MKVFNWWRLLYWVNCLCHSISQSSHLLLLLQTAKIPQLNRRNKSLSWLDFKAQYTFYQWQTQVDSRGLIFSFDWICLTFCTTLWADQYTKRDVSEPTLISNILSARCVYSSHIQLTWKLCELVWSESERGLAIYIPIPTDGLEIPCRA